MRDDRIVLAHLMAFARVYVGGHYARPRPGGPALGAAVAGYRRIALVQAITRVAGRLSCTRLRPVAGSGTAAKVGG